MTVISQFLVVPLIIQMIGTICVLSSQDRRGPTAHALAPLTISLCFWACSSLLARGGDHCSAGPGMAYTPMLAIGAPTIAIIVVLASCSRSTRVMMIIGAIGIIVALAAALISMHQFGQIPRFTFNPFSCARYVADPYRPVLKILQFAIPLITVWRDVKAVRDVTIRLSDRYQRRQRS